MSSHPSKDSQQAEPPQPNIPARRGSIISSFLSLGLPLSQTVKQTPRSASISSSDNSDTSGFSPSSAGPMAPICSSPNSSLASSVDHKRSGSNWSPSTEERTGATEHTRRASVGGAFSGFTAGLRWPGQSGTQPVPISIPSTSQQSSGTNGLVSPSGSAPTGYTGGGLSFRRAFELPTYVSTSQERHDAEGQEPRRGRSGRSGSLLGSLVSSSDKRTAAPRRKLSPMGERMIRDHPF